jgi:hypothetical protein
MEFDARWSEKLGAASGVGGTADAFERLATAPFDPILTFGQDQ